MAFKASSLAWLGVACAIATAPAQSPGSSLNDRLETHLRARLAAAAPGERLPVYFVLGSRLDYAHWFPRVLSLTLSERRRQVIAELREHAAATQRPLVALLDDAVAAGDAAALQRNWLGDFVQVQATVDVIERAAALPSVDSVWLDAVPARAEVMDSAPPAGWTSPPPATLPPMSPLPPPPPPGDGPAATRAAIVWFYGFQGQGVVIANVDGGLTTHGDLDGRRWTNPGEIPGNGIDDDNNGFIDDVNGWAFDTGTAAIDDFGTHGTQTAGLLVADGSCSGTAWGQAPAAQLMTCRVLSETSHWNAIQYAVAMGAQVQTSSFSYKANFVPPPNYRLHRDVATAALAAGLIRCNSTGNDGASCAIASSPLRLPLNVAAPGCVPGPYRDPNDVAGGGLSGVLGVGAWDPGADALVSSSPCGPFAWNLADVLRNVPAYPASAWDSVHHDDYPWNLGAAPGLLKPDVVGPGNSTTTSAGPCGTVPFSGTSNATPCVAGAIALWKSANPSLTPEDAAMIVHQTARDRGSVSGKENGWGAGILDAERGFYRALCVHRLDFQSQWHVDHSLAQRSVHIAVDGVPNSLAFVLVGYQRLPVTVGPLLLDLGPTIGLVFGGITDVAGHLALPVGVGSNVIGQQFVTQAVLWDQTWTQRLLDSNAVGITFVP